MRAYVFTDRALASEAGRFVWLEIDTEKAQNAPFKKQFPVVALPTMFIIDPATEKVALRWVGGATVPQLQKILDDGRTAVGGGKPATGTKPAANKKSAAADAALVRADALYGEGKDVEAAQAYREALAQAASGWPQYGRTVESLLFALSRADSTEAVAKLARGTFPALRHTSSAPNIAGSGLDAAISLPADYPGRKELVAELEADALAVVDDAKLVMAADDRSGVFMTLVDARKDAEDSTGARVMAERWAKYLEGEAAKAPNPEARTVFDGHRLSAYMQLGHPEKAIPMLQQSERDLPDDFNPPARLAITYRAMKQYDDALAASDRALARVYGPRKLVVLQTRADIYKDRGDVATARSTLEDALKYAEGLPEGQRSEGAIKAIQKKIEGLPKS
jgi:tetratricopeptide (TPR) repeat protein